MALTYNQLFEDELKSLVEEEIARLASNLIAGGSAADYPAYKYEIGRIAGLRMLSELCETIQSKLAER